MKKLSKREQILLYLLAAVVIIAAGVMLLIEPQLEAADALTNDILAKQTQLSGMQQQIAQLEQLETAVNASRDDILALSEKFLPKMTNDALDRYITGLIQSKGLTALSLAMSEDTESDIASNAIKIVKVEITASGYLAQFISLVETAGETDGLRISSCILEQDASAPTPTPTPTPKAKKVKATPTPEGFVPTPIPTPAPPAFTMKITFLAAQCDAAYVQSVLTTEEE